MTIIYVPVSYTHLDVYKRQEWRDRIFKGIIEQAGRDHFILHDPKTGKRYLLQLVYLEWAEFDEALNYQYPYQ